MKQLMIVLDVHEIPLNEPGITFNMKMVTRIGPPIADSPLVALINVKSDEPDSMFCWVQAWCRGKQPGSWPADLPPLPM